MSASAFHWSEIAPHGDDKTDRRLIAGTGADLKRVIVPAGTTASRHSHPFEQFFYVERGSGLLQCAAGEIALRAGTVIHFEPHAWHSAVFDSETVLIEVNLAE
jgi:quercetin dioxygenase-like cupin family protein